MAPGRYNINQLHNAAVLPETLTGPQLAMKLPQLYKTQCFITVSTQAHNRSLSSASLIEPTTFHYIPLTSTLMVFLY